MVAGFALWLFHVLLSAPCFAQGIAPERSPRRQFQRRVAVFDLARDGRADQRFAERRRDTGLYICMVIVVFLQGSHPGVGR